MAYRNSDESINDRDLAARNKFFGYIVLSSVLVSVLGAMTACSTKNIRSDHAPFRNNSIYSKNESTWPVIKIVAADTYRVCDMGGCTNKITRKTRRLKAKLVNRTKRNILVQLKPPIIIANRVALKRKISPTRIGSELNRLVLKRQSTSYGTGTSKYYVNKVSELSSKLKPSATNAKAKPKEKLKAKGKHRIGKRLRVFIHGRSRKKIDTKNVIGVLFKLNRSTLSEKEKTKLDSIISRIRKQKKIYIAGYIDNTSQFSRSRQKLLASKRAIVIAKYFKARGIKATKLKIGAYGKCCFGVSNDVKGINRYFRRAEVYFSRKLLLRHARLKRSKKLLTDRYHN